MLNRRPRSINIRVQKVPKALPAASHEDQEAVNAEESSRVASKMWERKGLMYANTEMHSYIGQHPKGNRSTGLGEKYGKWLTELEVRRCMAAGVRAEHIARHCGRAATPTFEVQPLVPSASKDAEVWGNPAPAWWKALGARLVEVTSATSPEQRDRVLDWIKSLPKIVDPQLPDFEPLWWEEQLHDLHSKPHIWDPLAAEVEGIVEQIRLDHKNRVSESWRGWVAQATVGSAQQAYRYIKKREATEDTQALNLEKHHDPLTFAAQRSDHWRKKWQRYQHQRHHLRRLLTELEPQAKQALAAKKKMNGKMVREGLASLAPGRGKALDNLAVLDFRNTSKQAQQELAEILNDCEHQLMWPKQVLVVHTLLLDKPNARGDRPICLLSLLYALWSNIRIGDQRGWENSMHAATMQPRQEGDLSTTCGWTTPRLRWPSTGASRR